MAKQERKEERILSGVSLGQSRYFEYRSKDADDNGGDRVGELLE